MEKDPVEYQRHLYTGRCVIFFTGIRLPKVPAETIDMMADMIGPYGMLLAGMAISRDAA